MDKDVKSVEVIMAEHEVTLDRHGKDIDELFGRTNKIEIKQSADSQRLDNILQGQGRIEKAVDDINKSPSDWLKIIVTALVTFAAGFLLSRYK